MALARNIAIVAVVALAIVVVPGGGTAADVVVAVISLAFLGVMAWFGRRLYMENRVTLSVLTTAHRALLYGGLATAFMTFVATPRLWESGPGTLAWLALLAASAA